MLPRKRPEDRKGEVISARAVTKEKGGETQLKEGENRRREQRNCRQRTREHGVARRIATAEEAKIFQKSNTRTCVCIEIQIFIYGAFETHVEFDSRKERRETGGLRE